jgi:hypothetical protein
MAHQMLKPYSFLLYGLVLISFFFVGVTYAGIVEAGKNQGLAGGAIVLGYGVMAACIGFLVSLFITYKTNRKIIFRINIILAMSIVGFWAFYHHKYLEKQKTKELENPKIEQPKQPSPTKTVTPDAEPIVMSTHVLNNPTAEKMNSYQLMIERNV